MTFRACFRPILQKANETLLREPDDFDYALAVAIWFIWFGWLCLMALSAYLFGSMSTLSFAQGTGVVSALAIVFTLRPSHKSQRLHGIMLVLCCVVYFGVQMPHTRFIRTFSHIEIGMTSNQVKDIMRGYRVWHHEEHTAMPSSAAQTVRFEPTYSGTLCFNHNDWDSVGGFYYVTFTNGRVSKIFLYDD
ncbi:MAG: hypothetical protein V4671_26410 [Armatimonadota bacterium]